MEPAKEKFQIFCNKKTVSCALAKGLVFGIIGYFVLYFPLGEPDYKKVYDAAICLMCDVSFIFFELIISLGQKITNMIIILMCTIRDILHVLKFMCYEVLVTIDAEDLCQTLCCAGAGEPAEGTLALNMEPCKCVRKLICCKRDQCPSYSK